MAELLEGEKADHMEFTTMETPVGWLLLAGRAGTLCRLVFPDTGGGAPRTAGWRENPAPFQETMRQLEAYFGGRLKNFHLPLAPRGTLFQRQTWDELVKIPYGETRSYSDIARAMGRPKAVRAVGAANGRNPLPIIVPCHRVVGRNGHLTGFGGGLPAKRYLLDLEGSLPQKQMFG